ncbi:MAG: M23 family metallopeptidase [Bacillota bacterium]|nr:M23 family metallopeptidase [Bacillota bacterium]
MDEQQGPNPGHADEAHRPAPWWSLRWRRALAAVVASPARRLIALALLVFVVAFGAYYAVLAQPRVWTGLGAELHRAQVAGSQALNRLRASAGTGTHRAAPSSHPGSEARAQTGARAAQGAAGAATASSAGQAAKAKESGAGASADRAAVEAGAEPAGPGNQAGRKLLWPVSGPVIAGFGWGYSITMHDWRWHNGIDIAAKVGAPVQAAAAGRVVSVTGDDQQGWTVRLSHVANVQTVYSGLERPLVKAGQTVEKGQVLGNLGGGPLEEAAEAPHLHFAILASGEATDPINFLPPLP